MRVKKFLVFSLSAVIFSAGFASCGQTDGPVLPSEDTEAYEVYHNMTNFSLNSDNVDPFEIRGAGDGSGKIVLSGEANANGNKKTSDSGSKVNFDNYGYLQDVRDSEFFNTASKILIYYDKTEKGAETRAKDTISTITARVSQAENVLSSAKKDSDIYRFNQAAAGATIEIDPITYDVLLRTQELYRMTDGAYNPAVSLSVDLWAFSPRWLNGEQKRDSRPYDRDNPSKQLPEQKYIDAFQKVSDYGSVKLAEKNGRYYVTKSESVVTVDGVEYTMQIDLGGFGKGYAADIAREEMSRSGFEYGYCSFGSSSLYLMKSPNEKTANGVPYDFGITLTYPSSIGAFFGATYAKVFGQDLGVSTSGNYENYYSVDGVEYCHIISPQTGSPIRTNIASACVLGGSAADNDALTTALCVMGKEKAISFVNEKLTDKQVVFVYHREATKK